MDRRALLNPHRNWAYRFGQVLRKLREERRLSLDQVEELSIPYHDRISTAYLSRCENGAAEFTLERLSILSKIYRTEIGMLIERREQERELDALLPADVEEATFDELRRRGRENAERGDLKAAFACFRAAEGRALEETGEGSKAAVAKARLSVAVTLLRMARNRLAKDEAESALALMTPGCQDALRAVLVIAQAQFYLGNLMMASILLASIAQHESKMAPKDRADYLMARGNVEFAEKRHRDAVKSYRQASALYTDAATRDHRARSLSNAANCYGEMGEYTRGLQQAHRALELSRKSDNMRGVARDLAVIGILNYKAGDLRAARSTLHECADISRRGDHHEFAFLGYFYLWKIESHARSTTRHTIHRVLRSLLTKLDEDMPEANEFRMTLGEARDAH